MPLPKKGDRVFIIGEVDWCKDNGGRPVVAIIIKHNPDAIADSCMVYLDQIAMIEEPEIGEET